eukprot:gnl/Dysnectes_brevis/4694_a6428_816.p1 GENE.gnl/Dysnectes_brevis/4694_a6428_816~~gnl/Dysnectes_brevis/4694_a6428_816.p1  ORF type:complete len:343 (+),score=25.74 gnl/Dysnectes_brevis/4694_a6428_816:146-1174(+)
MTSTDEDVPTSTPSSEFMSKAQDITVLDIREPCIESSQDFQESSRSEDVVEQSSLFKSIFSSCFLRSIQRQSGKRQFVEKFIDSIPPQTETPQTACEPAFSGRATIVPPLEALLPPKASVDLNKRLLVLDLDETLIHTSSRRIPNPDFVLSIQGMTRSRDQKLYVLQRPGLDQFLKHVGQRFEVSLFTFGREEYANAVVDFFDRDRIIRHRLYRSSCTRMPGTSGGIVKDLSRLGRPLCDVVLLDNSSSAGEFQQANTVPIKSFYNDPGDKELWKLLPLLDTLADSSVDISRIIARWKKESIRRDSSSDRGRFLRREDTTRDVSTVSIRPDLREESQRRKSR